MSARGPALWGLPATPQAHELEVLIPTFDRPAELAVTLSGLAGQSEVDFDVIISDQSPQPVWEHPAAEAMIRVLRAQGRGVRLERNLPRRGMAQQRHALLQFSSAPQVLYLDDDVWCEPTLLGRLSAALRQSGCGFVGSAVQGLSYLDDRRPEEWSSFEPWEGAPRPEAVEDDSPAFERWRLHNAANLTHLAAERGTGHDELYKVAWVGGCVLFDRARLLEAGGFSFWDSLPAAHVGEDALVQQRVMSRWGGAGLLPSGAVHLEAPTTLPHREVEAREAVGEPDTAASSPD